MSIFDDVLDSIGGFANDVSGAYGNIVKAQNANEYNQAAQTAGQAAGQNYLYNDLEPAVSPRGGSMMGGVSDNTLLIGGAAVLGVIALFIAFK